MEDKIQSIRKSSDAQSMSGDVDVSGSIGGSVSTMSGDIKYRKNLV